MLKFRDFVPEMIESEGFFSDAKYRSLEDALKDANDWINSENVDVVNVETVLLPNIWDDDEEGSTDTAIDTSGKVSSSWHQFIRIWYQV